ncbi:MAG: hypothetical protein JO165_08405 [Candidatus Eremiobacteraeota bacterium]|nr:hypothetical protein [Candidatus Eremiobacteraeota bacterium]
MSNDVLRADDITQTTYFACRNRDCEKYGNVFEGGDTLHANCARETIDFSSEEPKRSKRGWAKIAVPMALAGVAAGATVLALRRR